MNNKFRLVSTGFLTIIFAILFLEGTRWILGGDIFEDGMVSRWLFVSITLLVAFVLQSKKNLLILAILISITSVIYFITSSTFAAWILLVLIFVTLIWVAHLLTSGRSIMVRILIYILIALFTGVVILAAEQLQTRFSEEEFFVALQVLLIAFTWGVLALSVSLWKRLANIHNDFIPKVVLKKYLIIFLILIITGSFVIVKSYQNSFYPKTAPEYKDISLSTPYLCGEIDQVITKEYLGESVYEKILELVEANPNKKSPEFGMLALGHKTPEWKELFRESILEEARQGLFTQPNNSVKYSQYEAALRAYYYSRVNDELPDLFSPTEDDEIQMWFRDINQRAQTVEWIDWMYAIAYNKKPEGPYENQEVGAGLLSLLESTGLADPELSKINRSYLDSNLRGWEVRFRNTDDAIVYQPEWINNAFFQSFYTGEINFDNFKKSIQWLLIQSLPDGSPLKYNHIGAVKIADTAYQGASLLDNNTALWFAGNSIDYLKSKGGSLSAIPGVEAPVKHSGNPPEWGSCLIFGDSGLPNQTGPLAPDKITFRDGWTDKSSYMLVNLRFSGWHRYKATNTITMLYQGGPLVFEDTNAQPIGWLPIGRSLFRDKRIPRENLNGLIIEKQGLSSVIYKLTGITSQWAQDPPFYAYVKDFRTSPEFDFSHTVLENWRGWNHDRITYFYHEGPIIIVDRSLGPRNSSAAINWHVVGDYNEDQERINLTGGITPAEMVFITPDKDEGKLIVDQITTNDNKLSIQYAIENSGNLNLVTIFLTEDWIGSDVKEIHKNGSTSLELNNSRDIITVPLDL